MAPARFMAWRHHVRMACEAEMRVPAAVPGEKVFDIRRAGLAEPQPLDLKILCGEHALDKAKRPTLGRRNRPATDELLEQGRRIDHGKPLLLCFRHYHALPASGSGPYRLGPSVPGRQPHSTRIQIAPMNGTNAMSDHHPDLSRSCQRFAHTASVA